MWNTTDRLRPVITLSKASHHSESRCVYSHRVTGGRPWESAFKSREWVCPARVADSAEIKLPAWLCCFADFPGLNSQQVTFLLLCSLWGIFL